MHVRVLRVCRQRQVRFAWCRRNRTGSTVSRSIGFSGYAVSSSSRQSPASPLLRFQIPKQPLDRRRLSATGDRRRAGASRRVETKSGDYNWGTETAALGRSRRVATHTTVRGTARRQEPRTADRGASSARPQTSFRASCPTLDTEKAEFQGRISPPVDQVTHCLRESLSASVNCSRLDQLQGIPRLAYPAGTAGG